MPILLALILGSALSAQPSFSQPYEPGESYFGRNNYVEYLPGNLPLIFSAPHGGDMTPTEIPDRTYGATVTDGGTREIVLAIRAHMFAATGLYPHVVISHLKRTKLDPNREIVEAAQRDIWAETAWTEYHTFIEIASDSVVSQFEQGVYVDMHGHGHAINRLELGYLVQGFQLLNNDEYLNNPDVVNFSSIRTLAASSALSFAELLRGPSSLGSLFEARGFPAVPSETQPDPGSGNPFFPGGYSTRRHGSFEGGTVDGVQIEANGPGVRDTDTSRTRFAEAITVVFDDFFRLHYGWTGLPLYTRDGDTGFLPVLVDQFPNPFSGSTTFRINTSAGGSIRLDIYDLLGRHLTTLINEARPGGDLEVTWDSRDSPPGVYLYTVNAGSAATSGKLIKVQ